MENCAEDERQRAGELPCRIQWIWVRRGQAIYTYVHEVGPAALYPQAHPFQMWAAGLYKVGEVMEIMARAREGKPPEEQEPTDILEKYKEDLDEMVAQKAHRSVSGPNLTIVRS